MCVFLQLYVLIILKLCIVSAVFLYIYFIFFALCYSVC